MIRPTQRISRTLGLLLLSALLGLSSAQTPKEGISAADNDATVATAWFELSLDLVRETPGFSPPVASRAFGYLGVTVYEALAPGMPGYGTLAGQLNDLAPLPQPAPGQVYDWPTVANAALAELTRHLFAAAPPEQLAEIDALEAHLRRHLTAKINSKVNLEMSRRSVAQGRAVAGAVYAWSLTDGGHAADSRTPEAYAPPTGPGLWVSTPPTYAPALLPHWGENRPFALATGDACPIDTPLPYSERPTSAFYAEAREVYETSRNLTSAGREIALFWADEPGRTATPPGHWVSILNSLVTDKRYSLGQAAEAYAKVGIAVADAFIGCWEAKYAYNLLRPISYIQGVIDPAWNTPDITDAVVTPPFPEYPSGHSVASGAVAQVLTDLFGDVAFTDHTHDALGYRPRSYPSFVAAAEEAAISRLFGGIHYRSAIENGLEQGYCIGKQVSALRFRTGPQS